MSVRDGRKAGFVWVSNEALAHLRACWQSEVKASTGRSVYLALAEIANDHKARTAIGADASGRFRTSQKEIAERAEVSDRSAGKACEELERIGLVLVERDRDGDNRAGRPSFYILVEPGQTSEEISDVEGEQRPKGLQTPSEGISDVSPKRPKKFRTSLYRERRSKEKEESAREEPVVPSELAVAAWDAATSLLATTIPAERFSTYVEPLQLVGVQADALVLLDSSDHGGAGWVDEILRPLVLETIEGFAGVVVVDQFELDELTVLDEFDVWLADYHEVTGRTAMTGSDEARKSFAARRKEGRSIEELKLATRGCHGNDYLRREALDRPETILRKKNHVRYIELGRSAGREQRDGVADPALAKITGRSA